ncbi:MAG: pilus assembly protein PilM [Planctomycetaceae bacterium]
MAESLIIEWDRNELIAAVGSASGSMVTFRKVVATRREEGQDLSPAEIGESLRRSLTNAGIVANSASVVLPRSLVTFRRIELPHVPDAEVPEMVRLQAATRLTVPIDSVCLDFVPLPLVPDSATRDVLLVTLPKKNVEQVRQTLQACGLELTSVLVSSFAVAASLVSAGLMPVISDHTVEALVWLRSDVIEMIFVRGNTVIFSHSGASWQSRERIEQAVKAEVTRARLAAAEDIGDYTVSRVTLLGSDDITSAVPDSIARRLSDAEVRRIDASRILLDVPATDDRAPSDLLAIAGAIAGEHAPSVGAVDMIHPRRPPEKKDNRRLIAIVSIGAALLLLVGGWTWRQSVIDGMEAQRSAIVSEVSRMKRSNDAGKEELALDLKLEDWQARDRNWFAEMQNIQQIFGSTERVLIRELDFAVTANSEKLLGTVTATGGAKSREDVQELMRVIRDNGYEVIGSREGRVIDQDYSEPMQLTLSIPVPKAAKGRAAKGS